MVDVLSKLHDGWWAGTKMGEVRVLFEAFGDDLPGFPGSVRGRAKNTVRDQAMVSQIVGY
jgi:hypothetical protein